MAFHSIRLLWLGWMAALVFGMPGSASQMLSQAATLSALNIESSPILQTCSDSVDQALSTVPVPLVSADLEVNASASSESGSAHPNSAQAALFTLTDSASRFLTVVLVGESRITRQMALPVSISVPAGTPIYAEPVETAQLLPVPISAATSGETNFTASQQSADGSWLRIAVGTRTDLTPQFGWVRIDDIAIVGDSDGGFGFLLETSGNSLTLCNSGLPSFILFEGSNVHTTINNHGLELAGIMASHVDSSSALVIHVIDGSVTIGDSQIEAGLTITLGATPDEASSMAAISPEVLTVLNQIIAALFPASLPPDTAPSECVPRTDWPVYRVASGDTLYGIATAVGLSLNALAESNCIPPANVGVIYIGQRIYVPFVPSRNSSPPAAQPTDSANTGGTTGSPTLPPGGQSGGATSSPAPTCVSGTPGCPGGNIGG